MNTVFNSLLKGFPYLMLHSSVTFALLIAALVIYVWITPHRELTLIREGNVAAAISLSGAVLGLAIPLAFCLEASVSVYEILIWGVVTLLLQLVAFQIVHLFIRDLPQRIERGEVSTAIFLFSCKLAVAAVTAAAVAG
jgi:putative membrane protein